MALLSVEQSPPWCVAHRGFSTRYPENTHLAFEAALAEPIQALELDIQLSRDEVPIIYHNRSLNLVGGGHRRVRTQTLAQLQAYDFGAWFDDRFRGQGPALLEEVTARYGHRTVLLLEIKRREPDRRRLEKIMRLTIALLRRYQLTQRCYLLCYDVDLLAFGHENAPDLRFVLNQDKGRYLPEASFLHAYSVAIRGLASAFVAQAHERGKPVFTFTCDRNHQVDHALSCGADAIMSNDPHWLATTLSARRSSFEEKT